MRPVVKLILLIASLFFFVLPGGAQTPSLFFHLEMKDGLASNDVLQVQQDADGYLWVLSSECLQRYDGLRFVSFYPGTNGIPPGRITAIHIDKKNRLWIYLQNHAMGYLDPRTLSWQGFEVHDPGKAAVFYESAGGDMIIYYKGEHFITCDVRSRKASSAYNKISLPAGSRFNAAQSQNGVDWICTSKGLVKYMPATGRLYSNYTNTGGDPYLELMAGFRDVINFRIDKHGIGWITCWPAEGQSFRSIDTTLKKVTDWSKDFYKGLYGEYFTLREPFETQEGLWVYGENLFARYDKTANKFRFFPKVYPGRFGIYYDNIQDLYLDRELNLWIASNDGLYRHTPPSTHLEQMGNYRPFKDSVYTQEVTGFMEMPNGEVWVSTWGQGLFTYDPGFQAVPSAYISPEEALRHIMLWSMVRGRNGDIWIGAQHGVLLRYSLRERKLTEYRPPEAEGRTIRQVVVDGSGYLWLGTQGGHIVQYDAEKNKAKTVHKLAAVISKMTITPGNELWVGTDVDGVYRLNAGNGALLRHYTDMPSSLQLLPGSVNDILPYNDSVMLIVSGGINVLNLKTGNMRAVRPGKTVMNIQRDAKGNIWAATSSGLAVYSYPSFDEQVYDQTQGVYNFSFSLAASYSLRSGKILFGDNHGFLLFDPRRLLTDSQYRRSYPVRLAEVFINDRKVSADSTSRLLQIKAGPDHSSLRIRFAVNSFRYKPSIYFMLKGMNDDWKQVPANGELQLNFLPPGKYFLTAGIANREGQVVPSLTVPITVRAKFYKTAWFYVLLALIALAVIFIVDRLRLQRKEYVQKIRRNIVRQLHGEITNTLEKVNILSDIAILKHEENPAKSKEFITEIKVRSSAMISAMQDMVWSIDPQNDSTEELLKRFDKYAQVLNNRHDAVFRVVSEEKVKHLCLAIQARYYVLLLIKQTMKAFATAHIKKMNIFIGAEKNNELCFTFKYTPDEEDTRLLGNFLHSRGHAEKLERARAQMSMSLHTAAAQVIYKIRL